MKKIFIAFALCISTLACKAQQPSYVIEGRDTICQIFLYSPGIRDGLHVAYLDSHNIWRDLGQLVTSDYGPWGTGKRMYDPFVTKATDGTWRALWALGDKAPAFATAFSEDLVIWRPQDYPIVKEDGINSPVAYQMDDGSWDVYIKTAQGKRYIHASEDFRTYDEDSLEAVADEVLWQRDTAMIGGKLLQGNSFQVPAVHLEYLRNWFSALAQDQVLCSEQMKDDPYRFAGLSDTLKAVLSVDTSSAKPISDQLMGVFFEDINSSADGGLYAELVRNRDFEDLGTDRRGWNQVSAWRLTRKDRKGMVQEEPVALTTIAPLSQNNPHYVVLEKDETLSNMGWETIPDSGGIYDFSFYVNLLEGEKNQIRVALVNRDNKILAESKIPISGKGWTRYAVSLNTLPQRKKLGLDNQVQNCHLQILVKKDGKLGVDMISLFPHDTYKGHGLRRDLAETIASLHPKFVRFPGGCLVHGDGLGNIYRWKESIGPCQDRQPAPNIWGYHQTRGLGFYEYFQFCEDIGAEPLPIVAAGVPCQNSHADSTGLEGQQGGIPMKDMPQYVQDVLDLIEWANGDPGTSKWARKRAEAGHPTPFHLKMIGIGNEDLISTVFEQRYLMICKAVKKKYPEIEVIGTVGPFHSPSPDYMEGWKIARENTDCIDAVDEHYYEQPGWFLHHQDYYDDYDRKGPKVYLGEYASRSRTVESALAEALYLCNVERNGDVVERASYAPLLCRKGHANWNPDLIYFDGTSVELTPNYWTQFFFSRFSCDRYLSSDLNTDRSARYRIGVSVVKSSKTGKGYVKLVNTLPKTLRVDVRGIQLLQGALKMELAGVPDASHFQLTYLQGKTGHPTVQSDEKTVVLPPYSAAVLAW